MDIEKIKNFNQKLLAIFGILGIILLVVIIIWVSSEFIREMSYSSRSEQNEIVSNEIAQENYMNNERTHQISFEFFELIDTINSIYLVPVSQTALELKEFIDKNEKNSEGVMGLLNSFSKYPEFRYNYESYNNALIYNAKSGSIIQLFDKRVSINMITIEKIKNKAYMFMAVIKDDTDKDGKLDESDYKTLYIYSSTDNKLYEIKSDSSDYIKHYALDNNQVVIKYGLDKNNNGVCGWDEPTIFKIYSLEKGVLENFISKELNDRLQGLLDGKI